MQVKMNLGLDQIYGIRIYIDNRLKTGNFLPYYRKGRQTGDLRTNRKTFAMLEKALKQRNKL